MDIDKVAIPTALIEQETYRQMTPHTKWVYCSLAAMQLECAEKAGDWFEISLYDLSEYSTVAFKSCADALRVLKEMKLIEVDESSQVDHVKLRVVPDVV